MRLIVFSNFTSVGETAPIPISSSALLSFKSLKISLLISSCEPKSLFIFVSSSLCFAFGLEFILRASSVLILPFNELPGIIGRIERGSFITGESIAPIAENSFPPPICIPVSTSIFPEIINFIYITATPYLSFPIMYFLNATSASKYLAKRI